MELALCSCCFRVDAAREDGSLGRLVNDDHVNPNSKMKTIRVDREPHLCLFAVKDISPGQEIMYNYGDSDWPWRSKVFTDGTDGNNPFYTNLNPQFTVKTVFHPCGEVLVLHFESTQVCPDTEQQVNALVSCAAGDGSEKVSVCEVCVCIAQQVVTSPLT